MSAKHPTADAAGTSTRLKCPGELDTFYEGLDSSVARCSKCYQPRKLHKLPSIKISQAPLHGDSVLLNAVDPPVQWAPPAPHIETARQMHRRLPHWTTWVECVDSSGQSMYFKSGKTQHERPELPLPSGWIASLHSDGRTFYGKPGQPGQPSQWEVPLPLHWAEGINPDRVRFYVRNMPGLPQVCQSVRPNTFAFCPQGHSLRSYCDRSRPPLDAPTSRPWNCSACKSIINIGPSPAQGVLHCSVCTFTLCHSCREELIPLRLNGDDCPMLPGIGPESCRSFCHRTWDGVTCGTDGFQCLSCVDTEARQRDLEAIEAERLRLAEAEKMRIERVRQEEQRLEQQRLEQQRLEQQRLEQQRLEQQRLEQQRLEQQRLEQQRLEQQRLEQQRLEQQRLEQQRLEQQRLERIQKEEQQRLERVRKEEQQRKEAQELAAALSTAKQTAEKMHAEILAKKAKAAEEARLVRQKLDEWAETFCVARWVQVTKKGPHCNKFAVVLASPSEDGALKIRLFRNQASAVAADQITVNVKDLCAVTGDCVICSESTLLVAASASCLHEPQMCKDCMSQWVDAAFQQHGLQDIHCPSHPKPTCCKAILDEQEIRQAIRRQRDHWEKRLASKIQKQHSMIICAFPNCGNGYMPEDIGDRTNIFCDACKQSTCVACQTLVHPGRTCAENMAIKGDSAAELGSGVQRCPNPKCRALAVKGGDACDRLTCSECGEDFCANCSVPYNGIHGLRLTDNSAHEPTCRWYCEPETGKQPVYVLRKAADAKSKSKSKSTSQSPPPPSHILWTAISYPNGDDLWTMSQDQEPAAFAILEAEFAKGRGRHTAEIVLHGKTYLAQMNLKPNGDEFWLENESGGKTHDLTRELMTSRASLSVELPPRKSSIQPPLSRDEMASQLISSGADPDVVSAMLQDGSDPNLLSDLLSNFSLGPKAEQSATWGGGSARVGSVRHAPPPPAQEVADPSWTEATLDDGTKFWFRRQDPAHPTLTQPSLVSPLKAAQSLFSSHTRHSAD